jgi:hypothetical protein
MAAHVSTELDEEKIGVFWSSNDDEENDNSPLTHRVLDNLSFDCPSVEVTPFSEQCPVA